MASQSYLPRPSLPVTVPTKSPHYPPPAHGIVSRMSSSPPEAAESVGSSSGPSFGPSTTYSGYAASASDNESSSGSTNSIDLLEYMSDRLTAVMDPLPLDRSILTQAQTSGELNAKTQEILELQARAQRRLAAMRTNFADGINAAKDVQRELESTQKRVDSINRRAQHKYPEEFRMASEQYPAPIDV